MQARTCSKVSLAAVRLRMWPEQPILVPVNHTYSLKGECYDTCRATSMHHFGSVRRTAYHSLPCLSVTRVKHSSGIYSNLRRMDAIQNRPGAPCEAGPQPGVESARVISQTDWNSHKSVLRCLNLKQKLRLVKIKELMATDYGFKAR